MAIFLLLLLIAFAGSLGVKNVYILQVLDIILDSLVSNGKFAQVSDLDRGIVLYLRLPRVALAVVGGAALAIAGVGMNHRNPW